MKWNQVITTKSSRVPSRMTIHARVSLVQSNRMQFDRQTTAVSKIKTPGEGHQHPGQSLSDNCAFSVAPRALDNVVFSNTPKNLNPDTKNNSPALEKLDKQHRSLFGSWGFKFSCVLCTALLFEDCNKSCLTAHTQSSRRGCHPSRTHENCYRQFLRVFLCAAWYEVT